MNSENYQDSNPDIAQTADPMDVAAGDVDVSFPVLKDGLYRMTITKCEKVASKDTASLDDEDPSKRWNFKLTLATTETAVSTSGEQLAEGFTLSNNYLSISPTPDYDATKVRKSLAAVLQACFGAKTQTAPRQWLNDPILVVDSIVEVKIGHSKPTPKYPTPSNKIAAWVPRKE